MSGALVMFAIEAGVKLGSKLNDILVEETADRPLSLPLGDIYVDISEAVADAYFQQDANFPLINTGGPYEGFAGDKLVRAYRVQVGIQASLQRSGELGTDAAAVALKHYQFEQSKKGSGPKSVTQRILGTIVEIGIDYFAANPDALGKDSTARTIVKSLVDQLGDTDFAEGDARTIFGTLLEASLQTLVNHPSIASDKKKVQVLVTGVTRAVMADIKAMNTEGEKVGREILFARIGSSILRGGAQAFSENLGLYMPDDDKAKKIVESTLNQLLAGIQGKEDLFTTQSLEVLYKSALGAVAENADVFTDKEILKELIRSTIKVMTNAHGKKLFSKEIVGEVLRNALDVAAENMETLIDPDNPQQQLVATTLAAVARSLTTSSLAGSGSIKDLFSKNQLVSLVQVVLGEVAKHPEQLLHENMAEEQKTALAQIIGSVANSLGTDPKKYITGDGFVQLIQKLLPVVVANSGRLLRLDSASTKTNTLFKVLSQVVAALEANPDSLANNGIMSRDVLSRIAEVVVPVASANIGVLLEGRSKQVQDTVAAALGLAQGALAGRINGDNLPMLIKGLLVEVLWNELELTEATALQRSAEAILRAAA